MIKVGVGTFLNIAGAKRGYKKDGAYLLCVVKAEKGSDQIAVFVDNADEAGAWECGKITQIKHFQYSHKQVNGKWYPQLSMNVLCEKADPIEGGFVTSLMDEGNLPFN